MSVKRYCKTCMYWDRTPVEDAAGRVRSDQYSACRWALSAPKELPVPTWLYDALRYSASMRRPLTRALSGERCPTWEARVAESFTDRGV